MAGGYGIAGFGGGLAQGLAGVLLQHRQDMRQKEQQDEDRKLREASLLFPQMFQLDLESGDFSRSEQYLSDIFPHLKGQIKKDSPFSYLGPLLQGQAPPTTTGAEVGLGGAVGAAPASVTTDPTAGNPSQQPIQPMGQRPIQVSPPTFLGHPVITPEQRAKRLSQMKLDEALAELTGTAEARQQVGSKLGMSPEELKRYAATGQMERTDQTTTDAELFMQQLQRFTAENGRPPTLEEVNAMRQDWARRTAQSTRVPNLEEQAFEAYARDVAHKPVDQLTFAERLDARRKYGQADDAAHRAPVPIVIQTPMGPQIVDRTSGTARGITDAQGGVIGRNPSATERKDLGELEALGMALESVRTAYRPELVGPAAGRYGSAAQNVPGLPVPQGFADLSSKLAHAQNTILYMLSGKQISGPEAERLKRELPQITDKPEVFAQKLANTVTQLENLAASRKANMGGAPKTGGTFSTEYQGKTYTFDSQRKLDAFKLQFGIK